MGNKSPQNLKRHEESLSGEEIAKLNELAPGLGSKLHRMFAGLGSGLAAQAGHKGGVGIVKQKAKDLKGVITPALTLDEDRIAGIADPVNDLDAVNLRTLRRLTVQPEEEALPLDSNKAQKDVCRPIGLSNMKTVAVGMDVIYAVEVWNEYTYVLGLDGASGVLEIYVTHGDNVMSRTGRVVLSLVVRRMFLYGHHIYACNTAADSTHLLIINVKMPDVPDQVVNFNVGSPVRGVHANARFAYVACDDACHILDVAYHTTVREVGVTGASLGANYTCLFAMGNQLYAGGERDSVPVMQIFDISVPSAPGTLSRVTLDDTVTDLWLDGSTLYAVDVSGAFYVINVDSTFSPGPSREENGVAQTGQPYSHLRVSGELAVLSGADASVFALYDPTTRPPSLIQEAEQPGSAIALQGRRLYVGDTTGNPRALLRSYRLGGFRCASIAADRFQGDELAVEEIHARHGDFQGDIVVGSLHAEHDSFNLQSDVASGVVSASRQFRLGPVLITRGSGTPENQIVAPVGSLYLRINGGAGTTLYVKESGAYTDTGWVAK